MKKLVPVILSVAVVSGCATTNQPESLKTLDQRYQTLSNNEKVQQYAPQTLEETGEAVEETHAVWKDAGESEAYKHQHYLADRKADLTELKTQEGILLSQLKAAQAQEENLRLALSNTNKSGNTVMVVNDVLFEFDKANLKPNAKERLIQLAEYLKSNPETPVVIEGHTDAMGPAEYNMQLSMERAKAVAELLKEQGINEERIEIRAFGEQVPVASNETKQGRQYNRRAEIVIPDQKTQ